MMNARRWSFRMAASVALVAGSIFAGTAMAGPPLICFPFDNGGAKSLPWGSSPREENSSYDKANLVKDTLELLKTERNTLARMETLRRAAVYCVHDAHLATELLGKLSWIALDAEASGKPTAEAWFNPGFFAAAISQMGIDVGFRPGVVDGANGYAWIRKAVALEPGNAEMHLAAALALFERGDGAQVAFLEHLRKAVTGATPGSPLAKSIESNLALGGKKLEELRKEFGVADAGKR